MTEALMEPEPVDLFTPVRRLMNRPVIFSDSEATLRSLAETMAAEGVGAIILLGPEGPSMLVTERDIIGALADGADPDSSWGGDVASLDLVAADPDDSLIEAARAMTDHNIRHLPVRARGEVVGMVSARDLVAVVAEL